MSVTKVSRILVSQPQPAIPEKSPFFELARRQRITVDYHPFIRVAGVSLKEFRQQRVEILDHTAVIFTSRTTVDSFFRICEEARITVPETMKYICQTEAVALYLQKYIVYRKRKISFADGSFTNLIELLIKHKEEKFLLTLSEPHKPDLPETMAKLKFSFHPVILARTVAADPEGIDIRSYDVVGIYSPSEVKVLIEQFGDELPTIAAFGEAVRIAKAEMPEANKRMEALRAQCAQTLTDTVPDIVFLGGGSAHILSLSLPGYRSEVLMNYLEAKGIYVSKSSACKRGKRSHVLEAIGAPDKVIDGALRVSFSRCTTAEECAAYFAKALAAARKELYPSL